MTSQSLVENRGAGRYKKLVVLWQVAIEKLVVLIDIPLLLNVDSLSSKE